MCKCIKISGNKIYFYSGNKVTNAANRLQSWGSCLSWLDSATAEPELAAFCAWVCDSALPGRSVCLEILLFLSSFLDELDT